MKCIFLLDFDLSPLFENNFESTSKQRTSIGYISGFILLNIVTLFAKLFINNN